MPDALRQVLQAMVAPSRGDAGVMSYVLHEDIHAPGLVAETKPLIEGEFAIAMVRPLA